MIWSAKRTWSCLSLVVMDIIIFHLACFTSLDNLVSLKLSTFSNCLFVFYFLSVKLFLCFFLILHRVYLVFGVYT